MSAKNITYPLLFEGGDDQDDTSFIYQKFPNKEVYDKMEDKEKKRMRKDRVGFIQKVYGILLG